MDVGNEWNSNHQTRFPRFLVSCGSSCGLYGTRLRHCGLSADPRLLCTSYCGASSQYSTIILLTAMTKIAKVPNHFQYFIQKCILNNLLQQVCMWICFSYQVVQQKQTRPTIKCMPAENLLLWSNLNDLHDGFCLDEHRSTFSSVKFVLHLLERFIL